MTEPEIRSRAEMEEKLAEHQENLDLWYRGILNPTEPDKVERSAVIRELEAAIKTLEWALGRREV